MQEKFYSCTFLQNDYTESDEILRCVAYYRFRSNKSRLFYIVRIEQYDQHVYGVKFYLKKMQNSPRKYSYLTNTYEPRTIVYTIFQLMKQILSSDPRATFMFVGNADEGKSNNNTRRYRLYCALVRNCISDVYFKHIRNDKHSFYILTNRIQMEDNPFFPNEIINKFVDRFLWE